MLKCINRILESKQQHIHPSCSLTTHSGFLMTPTDSTQNGSIIAAVGSALAGFALFSMHDALIKSVQGIPTFQIVFFVVLTSFVPFTLFVGVSKQARSLRPNLPLLVFLRCLFTAGSLFSAFYAFGNLPMAEVYSLLFSAPVLITLLAIPLLGERVKFVRGLAIVLGLLGVIVVLRPGQATFSMGHAAALLAASCIACTSIVTRKIGSREHSLTLILYPMLTNVVLSGVALLFVYVPMPRDALIACCAAGLLSVIAQNFVIQAYRAAEAQFVAPMQYSQMIWAVLFGAVWFNETIDQWVIAGSSVIVLSGLMFIWRELVASVTQPVLRTRNLRSAGGPQVVSHEVDQRENHGQADQKTAGHGAP